MKAVDTNILVRALVQDEPNQAAIALDIVRQGVFVPITVLLELGWVLRSNYEYDRSRIAGGLLALLDNPSVFFSDEGAIRTALTLYASGADFADAIHLVASRGAEAFVTFDRKVPNSEDMGVDVEVVG